MKTFKQLNEYIGGFRLGSFPTMKPMASMGDKGPSAPAGQQSLGVGINAAYTTSEPSTMKGTVSLTAQTNTVLNKIKSKFNLTKVQLNTLTKLPVHTLTSILNTAGAITQYLPMGEQTELDKYFDNIEKEKTK